MKNVAVRNFSFFKVKAMELYDALESSGSYKREEITDRVDKYREKLMKVIIF